MNSHKIFCKYAKHISCISPSWWYSLEVFWPLFVQAMQQFSVPSALKHWFSGRHRWQALLKRTTLFIEKICVHCELSSMHNTVLHLFFKLTLWGWPLISTCWFHFPRFVNMAEEAANGNYNSFDSYGISVGVISIIFLCLIYAFKLERKKVLTDLVPGYKDWPIFGDVLHMERDPIGKVHTRLLSYRSCTVFHILCHVALFIYWP